MNSPQKILIIRLSSIGDIVLTTPVIRCLRKKYPDAEITFLIKQEFLDLIKTNPHLNHIITYNKSTGLQGLASIKKQIQETRFNVIVDIHKNLRSLYLRFRSGSKKITRYHKQQFKRFLYVLFKINRYGDAKHVYLRYFEAVELLGVRYDQQGTEVFIPEQETEFIEDQLSTNGFDTSQPLLIICPGASSNNKRWLTDRFLEVARYFLKEKNYQIAFLGGPTDVAMCDSMQKQMGQKVMNFAGQLKLIQSAALLQKASIVLTNDSGMMHLAQSQKKPLVAIFGPTSEELGYYPLPENSHVVSVDLKCRPCTPWGANQCPKGHFKCMKDIESKQVIEAIEGLYPS